MKRFFTRVLPLSSVLLSVLFLSACAQLVKQSGISKPTANLTGTRLSNLTFDKIDLIFDLAVNNQNPIPLNLVGLDYNLQLENKSLVSGKSAQGIQLKSNATSAVSLPISLNFADIKKLSSAFANKDNFDYKLNGHLNVKLPVIGNYAIPISQSGNLPIPKMPEIKVKNIDIKNMSLTSANVVTEIEIKNPNNFAFDLSNFKYNLKVNQQDWGQGNISQKTSIPKKGKTVIAIPVKLNLLTMGTSAYKMLVSKSPLSYQLTGNATLGTAMKLLESFNMPIDIKGSTTSK